MPEPRLYLVRRLILTVVYAESEEAALGIEVDADFSTPKFEYASASRITSPDSVPESLLDRSPAVDDFRMDDEDESDAWYDDPPTVRTLLARDGAQ
jgi:hypothetical protein